MKIHHITGFLLIIMIVAICFVTARSFLSMHQTEALYPSHSLTTQTALSAYFSGLKDSPGNTDVFIFESQKPGGTLLILGGTHPNEPAGYLTAILLVENLGVLQGKVIIIPRSNNSGFTHSDPQEGNPQRFFIKIPGGERAFRYGSRLTNPVHQWPDPVLYVNPAGQKLSGTESRNLNRCYPGRERGFLTERIAYGIMALIKKEKVDLAVDLHEAAPEYPVINAIVFHENSAELAALASMMLQTEGIEIRLEASPPNLRGLSHREWGDSAQVKAILLETANAAHGRLKGRPTPSLIIKGKDKNYVKAAKLGRLFVPFDEKGIPLKQRVFRHLSALKALVVSMEELHPELCIRLENIPSKTELQKRGIGAFLKGRK
jgi:hypothetical protein